MQGLIGLQRDVFARDTAKTTSSAWRAVADQIRAMMPELAVNMDEAEPDVPAHMTFPKKHLATLHSTDPIGRLNGDIKRRTEVFGIFPNAAALPRPAELAAIHPNPVHDPAETASQGCERRPKAASLYNAHGPGFQPRPFLDAGQHDLCRFVKRISHHAIAAQRNAACPVTFARLLEDRCQPQGRPD